MRKAVALLCVTLLARLVARAAEGPRFVPSDSVVRGPGTWVARGAGRMAHGAGRSVLLEGRSFDPGGEVADAAFVGRRLFLALKDGTLRELGQEGALETASVAAPGTLHVTAMDSWLVVAQDGSGLRFQPVAPAHACHAPRLEAPGALALNARFLALAAAGRSVYAATPGALLEIDARDPTRPQLARSIPHAGAVYALAASASRLYVLGAQGLLLLELGARGGVRSSELHPEVRGSSIQLAGRTLLVAGAQGLMSYRDVSPAAELFEVSANDDFFSPQDLSIAVGDSVRFTNVTGNLHNVESCSGGQIGCGGASATESFGSGPATGFWVLDHTFTQQGANPYVCRPHAAFMVGSVTVSGAPGTPPGVPDGRTGAPLRASKLDHAGSTLAISWDATTCTGAADHEILYGYGFGLPGATGGAYELAGARCSIGASSPYTWSAVPLAFTGSQGFLFFLVVATDAASTEGSWGKDGAGVERQGPAAGGASGECDIAVKSLTNACPP